MLDLIESLFVCASGGELGTDLLLAGLLDSRRGFELVVEKVLVFHCLT